MRFFFFFFFLDVLDRSLAERCSKRLAWRNNECICSVESLMLTKHEMGIY
jgi:hypothetical protein